MTRPGLTAVTITRNEAAHVTRFLNSHNIADELIVVDSGSTDQTVELAQAHGAKVLHKDWAGYAAQWNWAFDQCSTEWILFGDADHELSCDLRQQIVEVLNDPVFDVYEAPRLTYLGNSPLRHGGLFPDWKPVLIRRGSTAFRLDRTVHEQLDHRGPTGRLSGTLNHYSYADMSDAISKLNHYTSLEAVDRAQSDIRYLWRASRGLSIKRRLGYVRSSVPGSAMLQFVYRYFVRMGLLDGKAGFEMAMLYAFYETAVKSKTRTLRLQTRTGR